MNNYKLQKRSESELSLKKGDGPLEYVLEFEDRIRTVIDVPDCPDSDPYNVKVVSIYEARSNLLDFCPQVLPRGEYTIIECQSPQYSMHVFLGNALVPTKDLIRSFYESTEYHCRGIITQGSSFNGAIFLAIVFPDYIIHEKPHGVLLVQIASDESTGCKILVPARETFCRSVYETYQGKFGSSYEQSDWYLKTGAKEVVRCLNSVPGAMCSDLLIE